MKKEKKERRAETHHPERSKQEVQELLGAGVLDVLPQFPLQDTQLVNSPPDSPAPGPNPLPTSWLKACLNFCRQSTNSSSGGGLERRVSTPSGGQRGNTRLRPSRSRKWPQRDRK